MKNLFAFFFLSLTVCGCSPPNTDLRLYVLNCGDINMDMSAFSRDGAFMGRYGELSNPCFLIRHPKGDLLWDTGFEETLVDRPNGIDTPGFKVKMAARLTDQLAMLDLRVEDIEFLALSHSHPDHAGNANLFRGSVFLAQREEHAYMFSDERRQDEAQFPVFADLEQAETLFFSDIYDVFGDGRVVIHAMPGHTPGHSVLLVRLEDAGPHLLTGDLYIQRQSRELSAVPIFNTSAEESLSSMKNFEALASLEKAVVIIQHDKASLAQLPKFPDFAD